MEPGNLYIVATPIGNLADITVRALEILRTVDLIAAEDTRTTKKLLHHYEIDKPLTSYYEHNEQQKTPQLISSLQQGKNIALVSEAGTPTISDPGYRLVRAALDQQLPIFPIPGPAAALAALSISGLAVHRFCFEGFLPPKAGKRKNFLRKIAADERTLIFYESPYRIRATLEDMLEVLGDRQALLAREMTKLHETRYYGTLSSLISQLGTGKVKGEITLVVTGKT
ncbi:MAG: 16S rRNA (cytidine(1402)-2'-O)-methyltransferase [Deltaproteobacteria bacterium]|nr:16S rRNA (cytidine(1402)-2'-O)-methyltransferase [Deltaproteobacteria bacterium]